MTPLRDKFLRVYNRQPAMFRRLGARYFRFARSGCSLRLSSTAAPRRVLPNLSLEGKTAIGARRSMPPTNSSDGRGTFAQIILQL